MYVVEKVTRTFQNASHEQEIFVGAGRLSREPIKKDVKGGNTVVSNGLACTTFEKGQKVTKFVNLNVWNKAGDPFLKYGSKGKQVAVMGRVTNRTTKDGKEYVDVTVESYEFFGGSSGNTETSKHEESSPSTTSHEAASSEDQDPLDGLLEEDIPF